MAFLPHPRYQPEEYEAAVDSLRQRCVYTCTRTYIYTHTHTPPTTPIHSPTHPLYLPKTHQIHCNKNSFEDLDLLSARYSKRVGRDAFPATLAAAWAEVKGRDVVVLPSKGELLAAHQIEAHFTKAVEAVESKFSGWRAAAERGRVVPGFGEAAGRLYMSTLAAFDKATQPYAASPLRVRRHRALQGAVGKGVQELVRRQLLNLQQQGMKRFKGALLQHVGLEDREDRENASQKGLEEWFAAQADKVVAPAVPGAGAYERALSDFVDQLTEYAHKWPQSPGYNVAAMKRLEGGAKKKKGAGAKAAWGATFQLVSLLRTPGDGALQGFATYQVRGTGVLAGW